MVLQQYVFMVLMPLASGELISENNDKGRTQYMSKWALCVSYQLCDKGYAFFV